MTRRDGLPSAPARIALTVLLISFGLLSVLQAGGCGAAAGPNSGELMFDFGDDEPDSGTPDAANPYDPPRDSSDDSDYIRDAGTNP